MLTRLRRQWLVIVAVTLLLWIISFSILTAQTPLAWRWLVLSGAVLSYVLWNLWQQLALNHPPGLTDLFPSLGVANLLSIARGLLLGCLAGFVFLPWPQGLAAWLIVLLATVVGLGDWFDGFVARRLNRVTVLGQQLDLEIDALFVAVLSALGIHYGQLPWWFLLVGLARYLFVVALKWRKQQGLATFDLPPSVHRRILAGIITGILTVALWPIVPAEMSIIVASVYGLPLLLGFIRDWLIASGRLEASDGRYLRLQARLYHLFAQHLPLLWRTLLIIAISFILYNSASWQQPANWVALLTSWGLSRPDFWASFFVIVALAGSLFVLLGIAGRLVSLILLFPIGFSISTLGLNLNNGIALFCASMIYLFGTGLYSLWQPERNLILRRGAAQEIGDQGLSS